MLNYTIVEIRPKCLSVFPCRVVLVSHLTYPFRPYILGRNWDCEWGDNPFREVKGLGIIKGDILSFLSRYKFQNSLEQRLTKMSQTSIGETISIVPIAWQENKSISIKT